MNEAKATRRAELLDEVAVGIKAKGGHALPAATDLTKEEQECLSALKKCESMSGSEKQQCVDRTRKEYGHK